MGVVWTLWTLVLSLATLAGADITLDYTSDGFSVQFQGKQLLLHSPDNPVVMIGNGDAIYNETHGNFAITDTVLDSQGLTEFAVTAQTPTLLVLSFSGLVNTSLSFELTLTEVSASQLEISSSLQQADGPYNRLWVRLWAEEDERVWGAGEQYSYLNLRDRHYPIWTREQGVGRDNGVIANVSDLEGGSGGDYHTTYYPQASFLSSRRYSILIQQRDYLVFNFTEADRHLVYLHTNEFTATVVVGDSLMETVQRVTSLLGTQPPLPDWIITGASLGLQRGTDEVLFYYDMSKSAGVNISALWIQDWSGTTETNFGHRVYWNWRWNSTYYPGLDTVIQDLLAEGVRVMTYANPHFIEGSDMFVEAAAQGFLLKDADGQPFRQDFMGFYGGTVDLFNAPAFDWYSDQIVQNILDLGIAGWMADFGEYTRLDMFSANSTYTPEQRHNLLPVLWAECNRVALEKAGQVGQAVPFMRSGGLGSSTHQILGWAGDQNVNWAFGDGLPSTIIAAHSLAVSGLGMTHFDIGGYTTQAPAMVRSKELLLRSAEYSVFTPVMRTHEGNKPSVNHQFYTDEDTLLQFARLSQMHSRLVPYTRALMQDLQATATPVQRPLFLDFESDAGSWDADYQYMYGPDLLVAPVLYKGLESQGVYLPGGVDWVHMWGDGTPQQGPANVTVAAPMGFPAVFYRQDSPWQQLFLDIAQEFGAGGKWSR